VAKIALVTGAGVRLGQAIAQQLARDGYDLALHYKDSRAEETAAFVRGQGRAAELFQADLSRREAPAGLAAEVLEKMGGVDLLVNSAALFYPSHTLAEAEEHWDGLLDLNLRAPFLLVRHLESSLRARQGCVINIVDIYAHRPLAGFLPYCVSKGALWSLTQSLALQLAPEVRVNAVAPGAALPPAGAPPEVAQQLAKPIPLQRIGSAEDIAQACSYLAAAPFVTGQMIDVDGGRSLRM
jgi:pteridine reductase